MTDLQCAATLLLVGGDRTSGGTALGRALRGSRIASVYAEQRRLDVAAPVAGELGLPVRTLADLTTDGRSALSEVVDSHRGETALVVVDPDWMAHRLAPLLDNVPDDFAAGRPGRAWQPVEIAADADGWVLRSWPVPPVETSSDT